MWKKGILEIEGTKVRYWVKFYDQPSEDYGIEGGRISKMQLKAGGRTTLNYDRGWDIEPEDEASQLGYAILLHRYN
jgi:hypothetical protein